MEAPPSVVPSVVPPFTVPRLADVRPTASLTFKTQHSLPFGKVLKLVGEARVMGEWDCEKAPGVRRHGHRRPFLAACAVFLPAGSHSSAARTLLALSLQPLSLQARVQAMLCAADPRCACCVQP